MAFPTFSPPIGPSVGTGFDEVPRTRTANFGDGYRQDAGDGLNTNPLKGSVIWTHIDPDDGLQILNFFRARKGYEAFWWTPPYFTAPRTFKCVSWHHEATHGRGMTVTADFEEVFDLE